MKNEMPQSRTSIEGFEIQHELGHGGCGYVFLVHDRNDARKYAMKILEKDALLARFKQEIRILTEARDVEGIINIEPFYQLEKKPYFYVMEYAEMGDLQHHLTGHDYIDFWSLVRDLAPVINGLAWLHANGRVHRDIKPTNVLLTTRGFVLGDLGIAKSYDNMLTVDEARMGTDFFCAPEQWNSASGATPKSDQYSLAAVLLWAVGCRSKDPQEWPLPNAARDVLLKALETDPARRWNDVVEFYAKLCGVASRGSLLVCKGWPPLPETVVPMERIEPEADVLWWSNLEPRHVFFVELIARLQADGMDDQARALRPLLGESSQITAVLARARAALELWR